MKKDQYVLQERNQLIRRKFFQYLDEGLSVMQAYASTAADFYLSEFRIRDIISHRRC